MICPVCGEKTMVIYSGGDVDCVNRRRQCVECGYRFNTIEIDKDIYDRVVRKHVKD